MKFFASGFLILVVAAIANAQNKQKIDLFLKELNEVKDPGEKVMAYFKLSREYCSHSIDSTNYYAEPGIALAKEIKYDSALVGLYINLYTANRRLGEISTAEEYLRMADEVAHQSQVVTQYGVIYNGYALVAELKGNIAKQLEYNIKEIKAYEDYGIDSLIIGAGYHNLGTVYTRYGKFEEGFEMQNKALQICNAIKDERIHGYIYSSIGDYYSQADEDSLSIAYYRKALEHHSRDKSFGWYGPALTNLGRRFSELNELDSARKYLQASLPLLEKQNWKEYLAKAHGYLGTCFLKLSKFDSANYHIERAKSIAEANDYPEVKKVVYETLYLLKEEGQDFESALSTYKLLSRIKDSLLNEEKARQFEFAQVEYETEKKEQQIATLELEKQNEIIKRNAYLMGLIGVGCLLAFIVFWFRYRMKKNKQLEAKEIQRYKSELNIYTRRLVEKSTRVEELNLELEKAKKEISNGCPAYDGALDNLMQSTILTYDEWTEFKKLFTQVHPGFLTNLRQSFPGLTDTEERLFTLAKLNLQTKEIASMLGISVDSVNKSRYRLRKKLAIDPRQMEELVASF